MKRYGEMEHKESEDKFMKAWNMRENERKEE